MKYFLTTQYLRRKNLQNRGMIKLFRVALQLQLWYRISRTKRRVIPFLLKICQTERFLLNKGQSRVHHSFKHFQVCTIQHLNHLSPNMAFQSSFNNKMFKMKLKRIIISLNGLNVQRKTKHKQILIYHSLKQIKKHKHQKQSSLILRDSILRIIRYKLMNKPQYPIYQK